MALVSLDELKEYIGSTGTTHDSIAEAFLDAAEREVLNFCHRSTAFAGFEQSTGLARYYRPEDIIDLPYGSQYETGNRSGKSWDTWPGSQSGNTHTVLWLGDADLLSVDSLTNGDATAINSTSYWLEPRNNGTTGNGKPFRYIRLRSDESWVFNTDGEVTVTGTWGYSTGPDATIVACVKETAKYLLDLRLSQVWDVTAMPDLGQMIIPKGMPQHVKMALQAGGYVRSLKVY